MMSKNDADLDVDGPSVDRVIKILAVIVSVALAAVLIAFSAYFLKFGGGGLSSASSDWGTFGDFIGGSLNPLLSFFGLIALLLTIVLQGKELELTRKELKRSADSQEKTQILLDAQIRTQIKQQFESTYFSLLNQHNKILEDIQLSSEPKNMTSLHRVARAVYKRWMSSRDLSSVDMNDFEKGIEYFRVLYQVMRFNFIHNCGGPQAFLGAPDAPPMTSDEMIYAEILKAHLSGSILMWIAFYGVADDKYYDPASFSWLVRRYSLLEYMQLERNDAVLFNQLRAYYGCTPKV